MLFHIFFNAYRLILIRFNGVLSYFITYLQFKILGVKCKSFRTSGIPFIHISLHAKLLIGEKFVMGNSIITSASGECGRCKIAVRDNATLIIGNNVGMTQTTIECFNGIKIGNNVKIGFGTIIADSDFHSLEASVRCNKDNKINTAPIIIGDQVFIGAHCIILKGVVIGKGAIIGAGSVISKDIPEYTIYAGNPATFIRNL